MKHTRMTTTLTALAAAMSLSLSAMAGDDKDMHELSEEQQELLTQLDTNQDGVISEREALQNPELAQRFRQLDQDGDAILEKAEFARFEVREADTETDTEGEDPEYPQDMH